MAHSISAERVETPCTSAPWITAVRACPAPRELLEEAWEAAPRAELGDTQPGRAGLGLPNAIPMAIALSQPLGARLVAGRSETHRVRWRVAGRQCVSRLGIRIEWVVQEGGVIGIASRNYHGGNGVPDAVWRVLS